MERVELYLKTAFCCMACDGDIAPSEVELIKNMPAFEGVNVAKTVDVWTEELKQQGTAFLKTFLKELTDACLSEDEECQLAKVAAQTIEADNEIRYNEIAFFKKIRRRLKVADGVLLRAIPINPTLCDQIMPEDYLLPDISDEDDLSIWNETFLELQMPKSGS